MSFPIRDVFAPIGWIFVGLLAANILLYGVLVLLREERSYFQRRRERIAARLAPTIEALVQENDTRLVETIRQFIGELDDQERPVAAWLLRDLIRDLDRVTRARLREVFVGSGAVAVAERATTRWMPWRRALACEMLGTIGAERSLPVLLTRTKDGRSEVRKAATRALGAIGSPDAAPRLAAMFLQRTSVPTGVAYDALRNLGSAGSAAFRAGLASPYPSVRVASCFGLATEPGDERAHERISHVLAEDDDVRVRIAAAKTLGVLGGTRPPPTLVDAASHGEVELRREAVRALASYDDVGAVAVVAEAASAPDRETALRAAEALVALAARPEAGVAATSALAGSSSWSVEHVRTLGDLAL